MRFRTLLVIVIGIFISACGSDARSATDHSELPTPSAAETGTKTSAEAAVEMDPQEGTPVQGEKNEVMQEQGIPLSTCGSLDQPGRFYLSSDLEGAPVSLRTDAQLAPPYTGDRSLNSTCIEITSSNVVLDCLGHSLVGEGDEANDSAGIFVGGNPDLNLVAVTVENCTISGYSFGLYAGFLQESLISRNEARRNQSIGFYLTGMTDVTVSENIAVGNDPDGILLIGDVDLTVEGNQAFYNRMRGITFEGCMNCQVRLNESHNNGVLGFGIYATREAILEGNIAHDNRYHGFAILHEAGAATFIDNESYANDGVGFYLESSQDNHYIGNESHDNVLDGVAIFRDSSGNTFEGNTLRNNGGYGFYSDKPIDPSISSNNTFSGNREGQTGNSEPDSIDWCIYTGFGANGPCDPVFEGGPNLKDPAVNSTSIEPAPEPAGTTGQVIHNATIVDDPIYFPSMGDLWMPTWADDGRLFLSWGDGTGFGNSYPVGFPAYQDLPAIEVSPCGEDEYFPCWLWCNIFSCDTVASRGTAPLTDAGVMAFEGSLPEFEGVSNIAIDVPSGEPFFLAGPGGQLDVSGRNDKPSSLLFINGRLYFAGHSPAGHPVLGYLAYSDDYGQTWTELPDSPWGEVSNFRVLMFINMGQNYNLNKDGYVYALGVGSEAQGEEGWKVSSVFLTRVPIDEVAEYSAYEYFSGLEGDRPTWSGDQDAAVPVDGLRATGQGSAMYHEGTGRFLFLITDSGLPGTPQNSGALFEAPDPWGPWTMVTILCFVPECNDGSYNARWTDGKYIAGLIPKDTGPNHVYFTIAGGDQHYQLQIGKLFLETSP